MGFSAQSVPSLSKVSMRSSGLTKSGEPSFVKRSTKSMIAFFGAVSFHEGKGSCARAASKAYKRITSTTLVSFAFIAACNARRQASGGNLTGWVKRCSSFHYENHFFVGRLVAPWRDVLAYHQNARGPHAPYQPQAAARFISTAM